MKKYIFCIVSLLLVLTTSCGLKKPAAVDEREAWLDSLNDSIALYKAQTEKIKENILPAQNKVGQLLGEFDYIQNPREVEGYYMLKGWRGRYPLSSTGLTARVTKDERFEIIATLTGGHFNQIAVVADGETLKSEVVPHDQALNYRAGNLNKVCFYGARTDSLGMAIAKAEGNVTVLFLEGKENGKCNLANDQKEMVAKTWSLYNSQRELVGLEKELPRLAGKTAVCRRLLESRDSVVNN